MEGSSTGAMAGSSGVKAKANVKAKPKGKKKIRIEKIKKKSDLQVAFSKRRKGVFKKAHELSILTGAEVGVLTFSPNGNKVYSYGHSSIEEILERFVTGSSPSLTTVEQIVRTERQKRVQKTYESLAEVLKKLQIAENNSKLLDQELAESQSVLLGGVDMMNANLHDLHRLQQEIKKISMEFETIINTKKQTQRELHAEGSLPLLPLTAPNDNVNCSLKTLDGAGPSGV